MDSEFAHYSSYTECQDKAVEDLAREEQAGFVEFGPREDLGKSFGTLTLSTLGVVVTMKEGNTKHRLLHDLSRSWG